MGRPRKMPGVTTGHTALMPEFDCAQCGKHKVLAWGTSLDDYVFKTVHNYATLYFCKWSCLQGWRKDNVKRTTANGSEIKNRSYQDKRLLESKRRAFIYLEDRFVNHLNSAEIAAKHNANKSAVVRLCCKYKGEYLSEKSIEDNKIVE